MTDEAKKLREIVIRIIERKRTARLHKISPAWIATEAMIKIDPGTKSVALVRIGCHLHLRQIARDVCRAWFEGDNEQSGAQHEMFPDLQRHYPSARSAHDDEPTYVRLEDLTVEDVAYNVRRLRLEAQAKLEHADALEAWGAKRFRKRAS